MGKVVSKILSLSKWTLWSALVTLVLQLVLYYYIAQLIDPTELGNYFLVAALIFIPATIIEYSFSSSLIHSENIIDKDYKAVFLINLKLAFCCLVIGIGLASGLAWYYEGSSLLSNYILLAPILIFISYSSVQNAGLKKALDIKKFTLIELSSFLIYFLVTALFLYREWGVLAIIMGQLVKAAASALLLFIQTDFMNFVTKKDMAKSEQHWSYGKYIMGEKSLGIGMSYLDVFLVYYFLGPQVLGIYDLLKRMVLRPLIAGYNALEQVIFPMLTQAVGKPDAYRKVFNGLIKLSILFFVALIGLFFTDILLGFFPEAYHDYSNTLQLIIALAVTIVIFNPVDIVAYSLGLTKRYFKWIVVYSVLQVVIMIVSLAAGLEVFLAAMMLFNLVIYLASYFILVKGRTQLTFIDWAKPVFIFGLILLSFFLLK